LLQERKSKDDKSFSLASLDWITLSTRGNNRQSLPDDDENIAAGHVLSEVEKS
jgi:hypothetical protein